MSKPYTESDLSNALDTDLIWRRKELSDLKLATRNADAHSRSPLLKSIVTMSYAHWEGYVRACANKYFEHLTLRKNPYSSFERQIYVNSMLIRLEALYGSRAGVKERSSLINEILNGTANRFSYINPSLIDTRSNLNTDVVSDICTICSVDSSFFENKRIFIDTILLKRRNAIAHGQQESIDVADIDGFVGEVISLMEHFRALLENKAYLKSYAA